jgi:hypothetical protein
MISVRIRRCLPESTHHPLQQNQEANTWFLIRGGLDPTNVWGALYEIADVIRKAFGIPNLSV